MTLQAKGVYPYPTNRGFTVRGRPLDASILYHQQWINPIAVALNNIRTSLAGPNAATFTLTPNSSVALDGVLATGAAGLKVIVLDFPRNVVVTVTHGAAVLAESGTITGKDVYGRDMSEDWSVTAGGVSKTFTGKKAFKQITQVTITAAGDATTNTNVIGIGQVFGFDVLSTVASAVKEVVDGAVVTTGTLVAASAVATADPRGTYSPATAPDGAHDYDAWVISDNPEQS